MVLGKQSSVTTDVLELLQRRTSDKVTAQRGRGGFRRLVLRCLRLLAGPTVDINRREQPANEGLETGRECIKRLVDTQILDSLFELVDSDLTVL